MQPVLALSIGDVSGIGPEIAVRVLRNRELASAARIRLYGPEEIICKAAERFAPEIEPEIVPAASFSYSSLIPGRLSPEAGQAAYETIVRATEDVLAGKADALVTCPVNKAAINEAGIPFTGHT